MAQLVVYINLTYNEPGESPWIWQVAAIVLQENGHYVVDDIIYLKEKGRKARRAVIDTAICRMRRSSLVL